MRAYTKKAPITDIKLPFDKNSRVFCTHASGVGTHGWSNAYWSIDLATSYNEKNAIIYASAKGIAYVSQEDCKEPKGTAAFAETSSCGEGFGNWVKVYHGNGYYTFYAHLDRILINNGTFVQQGEPIGIEGWTGEAGHRHLHWSVQKLPGSTEKVWLNRISTHIGESVPFDFLAKQNNLTKKIDASKLQCEHANINSSNSRQLIFHGLF